MQEGDDYMQGGYPAFAYGRRQRFDELFRCYSVAMMPGKEREDVNFGGKIFLPASALARLASLQIMYPMLFQLSDEQGQYKTHAGVLEFVAEEGRAYLPRWMMKTLHLHEGAFIRVVSTSLELGTFVKLQPQSVDFLDIHDPRAVLENTLRHFSTLTVGDVISIKYNDKVYDILVMELKPADGVSVVETDIQVDFAPPVGYVEPTTKREYVPPPAVAEAQTWKPFAGGSKGYKLKKTGDIASTPQTPEETKDENTPPPMLDLPFNRLYFGYEYIPPVDPLAEFSKMEEKHDLFKGSAQTLRSAKKK